MKSAESNSGVDRKLRRLKLEQDKGECSRCPPHDGENRGRRPKDDKYKLQRKGRARALSRRRRLTTHLSGPMGQASMFPEKMSFVGRSMRR